MTLSLARRAALGFSMLLAAGACRASGGAPVAAASAVSPSASVDAELRAALQASAEAWNRGDLSGHLAPYADTTTYMTRSGPARGVGAIRASFERSYWREGRPVQTLTFDQLTVRPLGAEHALTTGHFVLSGGNLPEQSGWFSLVWARTSAGWRIVHDHSS